MSTEKNQENDQNITYFNINQLIAFRWLSFIYLFSCTKYFCKRCDLVFYVERIENAVLLLRLLLFTRPDYILQGQKQNG